MRHAIWTVGLTAIAISALLTGCTGTFHNPTMVYTTNKDAAWHQNFLATRITELQPAGKEVKLTGDVFGSPDAETRILPVGSTLTFPDHHGTKSYTIESITDRGVVVRYKSVFDHRSFGKNLIESDEGSFAVDWIAASSPQAASAETFSCPWTEFLKLFPLYRRQNS